MTDATLGASGYRLGTWIGAGGICISTSQYNSLSFILMMLNMLHQRYNPIIKFSKIILRTIKTQPMTPWTPGNPVNVITPPFGSSDSSLQEIFVHLLLIHFLYCSLSCTIFVNVTMSLHFLTTFFYFF
jgi:hypothetical protein